MKVTLWGTRGSIAICRPETSRYGGNTSCVEVISPKNTIVILDAGTGLHRFGLQPNNKIEKIHILLTHLHLDHIQGLGFFTPIWNSNIEVHIYGPSHTQLQLGDLITKYLSPPLFPVFLKDVPCKLFLHNLTSSEFDIDDLHISSNFVCHPGPTLGYRIETNEASLTYLPDHEPALGVKNFPESAAWTSGYSLAKNTNLLIHDSQYTPEEYQSHKGWGHSSIDQALKFAEFCEVKEFVTFHHDPSHNDTDLDIMLKDAKARVNPKFLVGRGEENRVFYLSK